MNVDSHKAKGYNGESSSSNGKKNNNNNNENKDEDDEDLEMELETIETENDDNKDDGVESDNDEVLVENESEELSEKQKKVLAERQERERIKKIKSDQKQALENMRKEQNKKIEEDGLKANNDRLKFLLQQTEIFSHFMSGNSKSDLKQNNTPTKRGRMTEKEEDEELMKETVDDDKFMTTTPDFILNGTMRDYQVQGLNWLIRLYDSGINGILADEMGLGKTLQTISFLGYLKHVRGVTGPHMIVTPKSTVGNWMNEFKKWCPTIKVLKFHGNKDERVEIKNNLLRPKEFEVCLTTYEMAIKERAALKKFSWRYIIIDEAHRIKNENSALSQVVRIYTSQCRLLITGTPLQNNLHELWALLNFLLPDVFTSADIFDEWFKLGNGESQQEIVQKLHKVLRPFLLRRLKSEVEKNLPPKREIKLFVGMSAMQREWYTKLLTKDLEAINSTSKNKGVRVRLLNIIMQLRKSCNHPYLFDGAEPGPPYTTGDHLINNCGKMVLIDKLLPRLLERGSRVLIFSQMTRLLDILEDYMMYRNYTYCRIDGSTNGDDRDEQIEAFNRPGSEIFAFLLSTRAGGLGINLATADTVILYDSDWNPQMDLQAQDRAHRIGQTKPVNVYRFVTEGTVEEKVVEKAEMKLHLDALVIQQGRLVEQNRALGQDELMNMIRFGADQIFQAKGSTITDEDIDLILSRGEKKTAELNEKLQTTSKKVLDTLVLDGGDFGSVYNFEGKDYSDVKRFNPLHYWIEPAKRERKVGGYGVDEYYRQALRTGPINAPKPKVPKGPKLPTLHDFQFYPARLHHLFEIETELWNKKMERDNLKSKEPTPVASPANIPNEDKEKKEKEKEEDDKQFELSPGEQAEKEKLLQQGFGSWTKREFQHFIKGSTKYGRSKYAQIASEIGTKTADEVEEYATVFWEHYNILQEGEKLVKQIEVGEQKLEELELMKKALGDKLARYRDPLSQLKIPYGVSQTHKSKVYTEEEDVFLVVTTAAVGFGEWEALKQAIRHAWQFRFDWFIKSRSTIELSRRVTTLMNLIIKEHKELEEKQKEKLEKEKKKATETAKEKAAQQKEAAKNAKKEAEKKTQEKNKGKVPEKKEDEKKEEKKDEKKVKGKEPQKSTSTPPNSKDKKVDAKDEKKDEKKGKGKQEAVVDNKKRTRQTNNSSSIDYDQPQPKKSKGRTTMNSMSNYISQTTTPPHSSDEE